jgi:ribosomal protein S14
VPNRRSLHGKLKLAEYRVLMTIWDHGQMPGEGRLAADTLLTKTEVKRAIRSLTRQGLLHDETPTKRLPRCLLCGKPIFRAGYEHVCDHCVRETAE